MGLVLVFDMDQTIIDSSDPYLFQKPPTPEAHLILKGKIREALNWNVVNLIKRAAKLRPSGNITAICLLTNNSSTILVSAVDEVLFEETGSKGKYKTYRGNANDQTMPDKPYFFDSIMMRQHSSRPKTVDDNPPKRLEDITKMMEFMGIKADLDSIYFFDDIGSHVLRGEFNTLSDGKYTDHYIQIVPPFNKYLVDTTDYVPVLTALNKLDGEAIELPPAPPVKAVPVRPSTLPRPPVKYKGYNEPNNQGKLPSAAPLPPTPYRPRSKVGVNENNLGLPPPPQEQSIRKKASTARPSLLGAFAPPSTVGTTGGSRKTRTRHRRRRFTRRRK